MLTFKTTKQIDLENEYEIENRINQLINKVLKNGYNQLILNKYDYNIFIKPNLSIKRQSDWGIKEEEGLSYSFIEKLNDAGWNVFITIKQKTGYFESTENENIDNHEYIITFC